VAREVRLVGLRNNRRHQTTAAAPALDPTVTGGLIHEDGLVA
jgi:hypothetical protein